MKLFFKQSLYSVYYFLAIILIVTALFLQWYSMQNHRSGGDVNDNYEELLSDHQKKQLFYQPDRTAEWLASLQHPQGYFVSSEERLLEPSQLNASTLETTQHAVSTLHNLESLDTINRKTVINYVISLYQTIDREITATPHAGFAATRNAKPALKATSDALTILQAFNGLNDSRIDLSALIQFIQSQQNSDGGFTETSVDLQAGQSSLQSTYDAVSALQILYRHQQQYFESQTAKAIRSYIKTSLNSASGSHTSTDGSISNDSYDTHSAYLTLLTLTQGLQQDRTQQLVHGLNSDDIYWYLIDQHYISKQGGFSRYQNKDAKPSLTATQKSVEVINGIGHGDQINPQQIAQYVIAQQTSSGQFGADVITTSSAIQLLQDLAVATKPAPAPVRVKSEPQSINQFIIAILFISAIVILTIAFSRKNKDLELINRLLVDEAHTDSVTGIYNRKYFEDKGYELIESCSQTHKKLTLISISVDELHIINDLRGHLAGDTVMKKLVHLIQPAIYETSIFARWGGGVFMILTPDMDSDHASTIVKQISESIEEHKFGFKRKLSCSFAVTEFNDGDNIDALTNRVDKILSKHKLNKMRSRKIGVHAA